MQKNTSATALFSIDSVDEYGIALLPITGSNQTFNSVVVIAADDVLQSYEFENYAGYRQVSNEQTARVWSATTRR